MPIHSLLRHRCDIQRSTFTLGEDWEKTFTWETIEESVPCLLDSIGFQKEVSEGETDRTAILFVLPGGYAMKPGDRARMTLGAQGTWVLDTDWKRVSDLRAPSHIEIPVSEVSA